LGLGLGQKLGFMGLVGHNAIKMVL